MRKFLIEVIAFFLMLLLYFGINMGVNRLIYLNQAVPVKDKKVLIAGDSHTQKSLNPKYFPSAGNISQLAEPYVATYWKLKRIFKTYTPDILVLGFAPHNISEFNDLKFSDSLWSGEMFKRYYPIEDFRDVSNEVAVDLPAFYKVLWKQTAFYPKINHLKYIGQYTNNEKSRPAGWRRTIERHYFNEGKVLKVSQFSIDYLDSIVSLCKSKNIEVVLVSNPVYDGYRKHIPAKFKKRYAKLIKRFKRDYLVFNRTWETYPDSLFFNTDHLNEYGAKRFSGDLIKYLDQNGQTHN